MTPQRHARVLVGDPTRHLAGDLVRGPRRQLRATAPPPQCGLYHHECGSSGLSFVATIGSQEVGVGGHELHRDERIGHGCNNRLANGVRRRRIDCDRDGGAAGHAVTGGVPVVGGVMVTIGPVGPVEPLMVRVTSAVMSTPSAVTVMWLFTLSLT